MLADIENCPFCPSTTVELMSKPISLSYKGELHSIQGYYYQCLVCREKFTTTESDTETLNEIPRYEEEYPI